MPDLIDAFIEVVCHHRRWYESFENVDGLTDQLRRWERRLTEQPETAIFEAMVREELERHVDVVFPSEHIARGGPDFQCFVNRPTGQTFFFVEATCITIDAVEKDTALPYRLQGAMHFGMLTARFRDECRAKSKQLANLPAPGLLAVGTLHFSASALCFGEASAGFLLTSETQITQKIDSATGDPVGEMFLTTAMDKSVFQRPKKDTPWILEDASRSVSGMLLCPYPHPNVFKMRGVLHPNAARPFDHRLMPKVHFTSAQWKDGKYVELVQLNQGEQIARPMAVEPKSKLWTPYDGFEGFDLSTESRK